MADKLTYKGGSVVVGSSGDMKLVLPKGGGDFHRVPQWWSKKGTVKYVEAAIFKVVLDDFSVVRLVIPNVKAHMTVEIRHDGSGNFTFPKEGGIERAAVVGIDSLDVLVEYQFSKISGGSVLKRTISSLPDPVSFGGSGTTVSGTAQVGETLTFTAATFTGGQGTIETNLVIQTSNNGTSGWSFLKGNPGVASGGTATYVIPAGQEGKYLRGSFQVTSQGHTKSSNSSATAQIAA